MNQRVEQKEPDSAYADTRSAADGDHRPVERFGQLGRVAHPGMLGMLATHSSSDELQQLFVCRWLAIRAGAEGSDGAKAGSHGVAKADLGVAEEADLW